MTFFVRRLLIAAPSALVLAAGALLAAPGAQADLGSVLNLSACNSNALSQTFLPWLDQSNYELAPGGTFADSSWSLSNGAAIVPGAEPWGVPGSVSPSSLSLPEGASAESPATCVDAAYPTIRFFVAGTGIVGVSVIYNGTEIPSGQVAAHGAWAPGPVTVTGSAITGALNGGTAQVSLRLTALSGNPRVSDVFIDPWRTG